MGYDPLVGSFKVASKDVIFGVCCFAAASEFTLPVRFALGAVRALPGCVQSVPSAWCVRTQIFFPDVCAPIVVVVVRARWSCSARLLLRPSYALS